MKQKPRYLKPQIISEGTLRAEDILPEFDYLAKRLRMTRADRLSWNSLMHHFRRDGDDGGDIMAEAHNLLAMYVAPYCYLGSNEGDGACIGVFVEPDFLFDRSPRNRYLDPNDSRSGNGLDPATERLDVSDHGNATFYTRNGKGPWKEIWAIV